MPNRLPEGVDGACVNAEAKFEEAWVIRKCLHEWLPRIDLRCRTEWGDELPDGGAERLSLRRGKLGVIALELG